MKKPMKWEGSPMNKKADAKGEAMMKRKAKDKSKRKGKK